MFTRILVPLNGSSGAEQALSVAANIARNVRGSIVLTRAVDTSTPLSTRDDTPTILRHALVQSKADEAYTYLKHISASPLLHRIPTELIVRRGPVVDAIVEVATQRHCDMIIMCSKGEPDLTRPIMGAIAEHVTRHAQVPVFVLRDRHPAPSRPGHGSFHTLRILLALEDLALVHGAMVADALMISSLLDARTESVHIHCVLKKPDEDELVEQHLQEAQAHLNQIALESEEQLHRQMITSNAYTSWSVMVEHDVPATVIRMLEQSHTYQDTAPHEAWHLLALSALGYDSLWRQVAGQPSMYTETLSLTPLLVLQPTPFYLPPETHAPNVSAQDRS